MTAIKGQALTTTPVSLFDSATDGTGAIAYSVSNRAASSGYCLVSIVGLVTDFPIAPGDSKVFRLGSSNSDTYLTTISAKSDGTATIDCGVVAKTHPRFTSALQ